MKALQHRMDELLQYLQPSSKKSSRKEDGSSTSSDGNSVKSGRKTREDNTSSSDENDPRRRRRRGKHKDDDRSLRLDVPEFNGSLDPDVFLDWLRRIERFFVFREYDDRRSFKVAELKLTSYASLWYDGLQKKRRKDGKSKISTWSKLRRELKKRFVPTEYEQDNYLKLHSLKQDQRKVDEYITEFEKMNILCDMEEKEAHRITRFVTGLNE